MVDIMDREIPFPNLEPDFVADLGVPFVCPNCNELFGSQEYLNQHTDLCNGMKSEFTLATNFDIHQSGEYNTCQFDENMPNITLLSSYSVPPEPDDFQFTSLISSDSPKYQETLEDINPTLDVQSYDISSITSHESSPVSQTTCCTFQDISHLSMQRNDVLLSSSNQNHELVFQQPAIYSPNQVENQAPADSSLVLGNIDAGPVGCPGCQNNFINQWFLDQHVKVCPSLGVAICDNNAYPSSEVSDYIELENKTPVECPLCKQSYMNKFFLEQHMFTCQSLIHQQLSTDIDQPTQILSQNPEVCEGPSMQPVPDKDNQSHFSSSSTDTNEKAGQSSPSATSDKKCENDSKILTADFGEQFHVCPDCGKSFSLKSNLLSHIRVHTGEKPFNCEQCGQKFSHKGNLKKHYRVHTQEKPYHCTVCGVSFSHRSGLTIHSRTHTGEKPFECAECGQKFSCNGNLKKHMRIHSGEKPFGCKSCGRRYKSDEALKAHTLVHTGEKSFPCSQCDAAFTHKGGLEAHFRTHTGEKPYSCNYCDLTFARRGGLKAHVRTHTGEKPYVCSFCDIAFAHKSNLNAHVRTHTGEKPFNCSLCDQKFAHKSNLKKHLISHLEESSGSGSLSDSSCPVSDSVTNSSSSVISTVTKMTSVVVSPLSDYEDSNFMDLIDTSVQPSSQALLIT